MAKREFTSKVAQFNSNLYGFHLMVPMDIAAFYLDRSIKRFLCSINGHDAFPCAFMPRGDGRFFIMLNKERINNWQLVNGQTVTVEIWQDKSKYGMPMPEELSELMKIDEEGSQIFHTLTPGKQRSLIYIIGKPKRSETRLKKAWIIIEYLKLTRGKLDYQSLNEALRSNRDIGF